MTDHTTPALAKGRRTGTFRRGILRLPLLALAGLWQPAAALAEEAVTSPWPVSGMVIPEVATSAVALPVPKPTIDSEPMPANAPMGTIPAAGLADEAPGGKGGVETYAPSPEAVAAAKAEAERKAAAEAIDKAARAEDEMFGPPSPKAERGKIPEIAWEAAPREVPPALEEAVRIVTRNYPSARSSRAALRAAAADVKTANWQRYPALGVEVGFLDSVKNPEPQLTVEVPIWTGGRIDAGIRRATASENVASTRYVETVENLALTTSQTYFEIARLTKREQMLTDSIVEHNRLVGTMERRVKYEVSPQADLELARSRVAQIEQEYTITRAQRQSAMRVLAELVADPSYDLGPMPFFQEASELDRREDLVEQAKAYDPTIRRLTFEADVAKADHDSNKAALFPRLNGQYSYNDFFGSRIGVVARLQTAAGLSQLSQIESARLRIDSATEAIRQAEQQLSRQIDSDIIEYEAGRARASISRTASDTAARVSASYMRQFIAGRRSWLDVMNALREAVNAQIGRSDAEITAMSASVRLLLRSGRWQPYFDKTTQ